MESQNVLRLFTKLLMYNNFHKNNLLPGTSSGDLELNLSQVQVPVTSKLVPCSAVKINRSCVLQ